MCGICSGKTGHVNENGIESDGINNKEYSDAATETCMLNVDRNENEPVMI